MMRVIAVLGGAAALAGMLARRLNMNCNSAMSASGQSTN
jgi:hypothetical protein